MRHEQLKTSSMLRSRKTSETAMSTSSLASVNSESSGSNPPSVCSNLTMVNSKEKEVLSIDKCPKCRTQFDFIKRVNVTKVPLILNCKHTVCEDCIRKMSMANNAACPICKEKFAVTRSQIDALPELFPPHYTLIGQLVWTKNSPNSKKNTGGMVSTGITLGRRHFTNGDLFEYHKDIEVKSEDEDEDADRLTLSFSFDKCPEHTDQFLNIHCTECNDTYCCYCFLENHGGHKPSYLYKLNDEEANQLEKLKTDVEVVLQQLLASRKKVKELSTFDTTNVDQDIKNYFIYLHAKLYVAESSIRKRLSTFQSEGVDLGDLNYVKDTLKTEINRVSQVLDHFNSRNSKQLNLRALYDEARNIKEMPCRLVTDQGYLKPIEFIGNSILDDIEERIDLKAFPPMEYNLLPIEDWTEAQEKFDVEQIRRSGSQNQIEQKSEVSVAKPPRHSDSENRKTDVSSAKVRVQVTHINNLNSFFVQKYSALDCLRDMNSHIGRRNRRKTTPEEFKLGGTYGVLYETKNSSHNQWRRGQILEIVTRSPNNHQYKVYFVDYGNTQYVTREKLKELDLGTIRRPSFAIECKLTNPDKINIDTNAHLRLPQIIGEKELYLRFMNKLNDRNPPQEVELLVAASNGSCIPVRELLFNSPTPKITTKERTLVSQYKFFKNSKKFQLGADETVVVVHIKDPFNIYVQMASTIKLFDKMKNELARFYEDKPHISCIPVADTDVVVKYEDPNHGRWHRATIKSVNITSKEVEVFFVDWGKTTVVSWSHLRLLTENFIKSECLCIAVKLTAIEKLDLEQPWSPKCISFLQEQIQLLSEEYKMTINKDNPLEVAMFRCGPSSDICINALLVEHKYALSTNPLSAVIYWPHNTPCNMQEYDDLAYQMVKKSEEIILADDEDEDQLKGDFRMQVSVIDFQSPDLIHVKLMKYKEKEDEMHRDLQIYYSTEKPQKKNSWIIGEKCVVYDSVRKNYFRGSIKKACGDKNYIVYLYDHARELKVSNKAIFQQDSYFQQFTCCVFKCRISNIKPAGDAGTWSHLAIEMLQKIFATYKTIYVKKVETNLEQRMIGVVMWYALTTAAKALEPARVKYVSISQSLIEGGVAFVSSSLRSNPPPEINESINKNSIAEKSDSDIEFEDAKEDDKKKDWYDMICEDEKELQAPPQNSWPDPIKISKRDFNAIVTCVDNDGYFSIRDKEVQAVYLELEENLTNKLRSLPRSTEDNWRVHDMCSIAYEDKWYRGTVLEILSDDEIRVEMIDFGSDHVVSREDLSEFLMFAEFPPLINKVRLYDVYSNNGLWTADDVSALLSIVTDNVRVVIKGSLDLDVPFAEIYLENGISANDMITKKCPHMTRRENTVALVVLDDDDLNVGDINFEAEASKNNYTRNGYRYPSLRHVLNKKQKMHIVNVLKWGKFYNVVLSSNESFVTSKPFKKMTDSIQKDVGKQVSLQSVELNTPCICLHPQKNVWSRALVYNLDSLNFGFVLVFFVDYGSAEMVPRNSLKDIRSDWLCEPVYMQIAALNVELLQEDQADYVFMQLSTLRGKSIPIEVVSESPLKVHLYDGKNLYYENFIVCGILKAL